MKTLYFIGNEELWNDAWFTALVESLEKKSNLSVFVYDVVKDLSKIKVISNRLTVADRVILKKGLSIDLGLENKYKSLVYVLSKQKEDLNNQLCVEWGALTEPFLEKIGMSEASNVIEDDFLSEMNVLSEVSKVIEAEQKSTLDNDALSSSPDDLSKLLEADFSSDPKETPSQQDEISLEVVLEQASDTKDEKIEEALDVSVDDISLDSDIEGILEGNLVVQDIVAQEEKKSSDSDALDLMAALEGVPQSKADPAKEQEAEGKGLDLLGSLENPIVPEEKKSSDLDALDLMAALEGVPQSKEEPAKQEEAEEKLVPDAIKPEIEVGHLLSSMSSEVSNEDMDVIKRYSNIKERELREAQASAEALRRQIRYFDERLKKSEEERRKLILKIEEVQSELRTTSDKKDEKRAQLKNIENHYEEKIKELQIQLESSQFQAGKLEKKLEDFRDRVRSDLQKIRSRERELASRLEIQKRDAEALLSAKDERLLNQKRDIDRLEFEIDSLRERLIEDVNRSEERRKRIARSLQSLKLAQSVLSGLDEESLQKDEKNKAA